MKESGNGESGQVLILVTIFLLVLVCFVALAADVGMMFRHKRTMQEAADAAAVAGALAYRYGPGTATSAAQSAALANGVTNASYVTVSTSPSTGYHTGTGFIQVVINQPKPTYFMKVANISTFTVSATSVAGVVPNNACLISLEPTAADSFDVQGSATITTPDCAVHINSKDNSALCSTGQATINAPFIGINGYQNGSGKCNGTQQNVSSDNGVVPDPYANTKWLGPVAKGGDGTCDGTHAYENTGATVTAANVGSLTSTTDNGTTVYCFKNAVAISSGVNLGSWSSCTTSSGIATQCGGNKIFVFENGVTFSGNTTVGGTVDIQGGSYTATTNQVTMYAPAATADTYNSLALMVDPSDTSVSCDPSIKPITLSTGSKACLQIQFGSGGYGSLDGVIYAPNATVYMQDNGGGTTVAGIVAGAIYDKSSTLVITQNYNLAFPSSTPMSTMAMVE